MKERPILFSGPMVRAILDGHKTQTRRVVKPQPTVPADVADYYKNRPYGIPGDRLWVRETFAPLRYYSGKDAGVTALRQGAFFRADYPDGDLDDVIYKWKPSIHMPRKYCRLLLDVKAVRVERLHKISDADVQAEGISEAAIEKWRKWLHPNDAPGKAFGELWDVLNEKRGFGWDTNPWVWVIEFEPIQPDLNSPEPK